ncbi:MAG: MetQ/NlpA family ABC transporter substrate-binding protein [Anaerolineae bacterium]
MRSYLKWVTSGLLVLMIGLAACAPPTGPVAPAAQEDNSVRFGVLPILDVVPAYVAEQEGYFEELGLDVELVPVKSAQERDTLMQTGQIDGQLNELLATALFNKETPRVKVVYVARKSQPGAPLFRILAAPGSDLRTPADLKGVPIGISQNTIIEYITDRMLRGEGLTPEEIVYTEVSAIPVRFELLMKGQIQAATLPDPLAQGAMAGGATLIVDDSKYQDFSLSTVSFSTKALTEKPGTVRKFLQAWDRAARAINENPDAYRGLLVEKGRVPESIAETFTIPPYPVGEIPTEAQAADVVTWLLEKGLIDREMTYDELVDPGFLPEP